MEAVHQLWWSEGQGYSKQGWEIIRFAACWEAVQGLTHAEISQLTADDFKALGGTNNASQRR